MHSTAFQENVLMHLRAWTLQCLKYDISSISKANLYLPWLQWRDTPPCHSWWWAPHPHSPLWGRWWRWATETCLCRLLLPGSACREEKAESETVIAKCVQAKWLEWHSAYIQQGPTLQFNSISFVWLRNPRVPTTSKCCGDWEEKKTTSSTGRKLWQDQIEFWRPSPSTSWSEWRKMGKRGEGVEKRGEKRKRGGGWDRERPGTVVWPL